MLGKLCFMHVHCSCESDLSHSRENRGFTSLPICLVFELLVSKIDFAGELYRKSAEIEIEDAEGFAEDLYLASIAISGFLNESSYASAFSSFMLDEYRRALVYKDMIILDFLAENLEM